MLPQRPPPPPPWAGAARAAGATRAVAPWAVAVGTAHHVHTTQRVDDERARMVPVARVAVAVPARLLPRQPSPPPRQRGPAALAPAISSGSTGTTRRTASRRRRTTRPSSSFAADRPPRRTGRRRRRRHRLHLAAQGRVGRARPRHPVPVLAGLGRRVLVRAHRQPVDALPGRAGLPPARATRTGRACCTGGSPGSSHGFPERRGRRLRRCSRPARRWSCRSRRPWPAWPSSPGRPASCMAIAASHQGPCHADG